MKYYYFDSSALVKRYAPEKGTDRVDGIFHEKDRVLIIANIGIVEIYSALSKKKREKEITEEDLAFAIAKCEEDIKEKTFQFLELDNFHILKCKELLLKHDTLRTYDALRFSLALDLKALKVTLVSSDHILNQAAIAENITTINPENQNALPCP